MKPQVISMWNRIDLGVAALLMLALFPAFAAAGVEQDSQVAVPGPERTVPQPLTDHPGNVFLTGETVVVPAPSDGAWSRFRVLNEADGAFGAEARPAEGGRVALGPLPAGWYRIEFVTEDGTVESWTTAAVLEPLAAPVPQDSPICIDTAMAWFARNNAGKQRNFASLAALAGVNWSRDRMSWGDVQTAPDTYAEEGCNYDTSADAAAGQGLGVLQVFHHTPSWAVVPELDGEEPGGRFPRDLRALYGFCRAMAQRYEGRVQAWEPWNEANIDGFGGHLINEMCSLQKAAYLAFKAGDPDVTVCWNVYAGSGSRHHTDGVFLNEVWPYYETYNIHTYSAPEAYLGQFEGPREAACGRPIWLTECGIRLYTSDAPPWGELSREDEHRQAEFIARSYANSLYAGVDRHYFFILGNYIERGVQFGLLRHDLTPRPGYVALAAVGRILAGARPLGRVSIDEGAGAWAYVFRAQPNGKAADVIVAWSNSAVSWQPGLKQPPLAVCDYLGRELTFEETLELGPKAVFIVAPESALEGMALEAPPEVAAFRDGDVSTVVMQVELPRDTVRLGPQAYEFTAGAEAEIPIWVYNFSSARVSGTVSVDQAPDEWQVACPDERLDIEPMERRRIVLRVTMLPRGEAVLYGAWLRVRGHFGDAGNPVVAFRLLGDRNSLQPASVTAIPGAKAADRWADNAVGDATLTHRAAEDGAMEFAVEFGEMDPWAYPRLSLEPGERPVAGDHGIALDACLMEGEGTMRVQFIEDTGASYVATLPISESERESRRVTAFFQEAVWGAHSQPDPSGALEPSRIVALLVGINAERNAKVRFAIDNLAWVRF